jgi:hypothetical protein
LADYKQTGQVTRTGSANCLEYTKSVKSTSFNKNVRTRVDVDPPGSNATTDDVTALSSKRLSTYLLLLTVQKKMQQKVVKAEKRKIQ